MKGGLAFIGFMILMVVLVMWNRHEYFKDLTPAQSTAAACMARGEVKAMAGCFELCAAKYPNATEQGQCRAQVVKEYED